MFKGSCHCGAVTFEADLDLEAGTGRCNCSICMKKRAWGVIIKPDQFRLQSGEANLSSYQFANHSGHHRFCRTCGVEAFGDGYVEALGGAYVSVSVSCLDGVADEEFAALPISYANGRDDLWWEEPKVTAFL
jgi:hypothetical protein